MSAREKKEIKRELTLDSVLIYSVHESLKKFRQVLAVLHPVRASAHNNICDLRLEILSDCLGGDNRDSVKPLEFKTGLLLNRLLRLVPALSGGESGVVGRNLSGLELVKGLLGLRLLPSCLLACFLS